MSIKVKEKDVEDVISISFHSMGERMRRRLILKTNLKNNEL